MAMTFLVHLVASRQLLYILRYMCCSYFADGQSQERTGEGGGRQKQLTCLCMRERKRV